ncbi:MAG TPA: hypothetical protein VMD92_14265 [Acidobacteriaceae bacterium]|jgi:Flp pilus assembly pilin Flp|nr:hypothetical protein [Acidobacteriaceae bacterium]
MLRFANLLVSLVVSDCGGDVIEYALLAALIAITTIKAVSTFGDKHLLKYYTTIATDLQKDFKK